MQESIITKVDTSKRDIQDYIHKFNDKAPSINIGSLSVPEEKIPRAYGVEEVTFNNGSRVPITHVVKCPHANLITFWQPTTVEDMNYKTPFSIPGEEDKYVTFEPGISSV